MSIFVNTRYFSESANFFKKNGVYTNAPFKSRDYYDFWEEEEKRCLNGYSVGGLRITGRHYHYLNYMPIEMKPENPTAGTMNFPISLPDFREIDYEWYNAVDRALAEGKHLACLKTRRAGWSYKVAHMGVYNYNFIKNSKSIYTASGEPYLTADGVLNKAWLGIDWHNEHTQDFWYKNRHFKDTMMHKKASYKDSSTNVERGYLSQIMGVVVDNPNKMRGKAGNLIVFEEAGSYTNLLDAWQIAYGSVTQGSFTRGLMVALGTGGQEGPSLEGLEQLYYNPDTYNLISFENKWEDGRDKVGFFVPAYKVTDGFFNEEGVCDEVGAREFYEKEREIKAQDKNPKTLDRYIAEFPFTPQEALQRINSNPFPIKDLRIQKERVMNNESLRAGILNGRMFRAENGKPQFKPTKDKPYLEYPVKPNDKNIDGCITIYQTPFEDEDNVTPNNLYFIVTDPVVKDRTENMTSDSIFASYVYKRDNQLDYRSNNCIVASYVGRPRTRDEYYTQLFMLAEYYNATIQCEAGGGGDGVFDYAKRTKNLKWLAYDVIFDNKKEMVSQKNRSYLMVMNTQRKEEGIRYLAQWLMEPRGLDETNGYVYNYNKIYDIALLEELIKYNDNGNFDRVSALIIAMFMIKEYHNVKVRADKKTGGFFNRPLFIDSNLQLGKIQSIEIQSIYGR